MNRKNLGYTTQAAVTQEAVTQEAAIQAAAIQATGIGAVALLDFSTRKKEQLAFSTKIAN